jgi:hypothetical protein
MLDIALTWTAMFVLAGCVILAHRDIIKRYGSYEAYRKHLWSK